jgi:hypothetical protein
LDGISLLTILQNKHIINLFFSAIVAYALSLEAIYKRDLTTISSKLKALSEIMIICFKLSENHQWRLYFARVV